MLRNLLQRFRSPKTRAPGRSRRSRPARKKLSSFHLEDLEPRTLPTVTFQPFLDVNNVPPAITRVLDDQTIGDLKSPLLPTSRAVDPVLSVSDQNPGNIAIASQYGLRVSPYDGGTFNPPTPTLFPNSGSESFDASTTYDSQGRLFWVATDATTGRLKVAQINPSLGTVIGGPSVVAATPTGSMDTQAFLASDANGNLFVAWTRVTGSTTQVYVSRSAGGGSSWLATPVLVSATTGEGTVGPASVAVGPAGDVFVAYHSQTGFNGPNPDGSSGKTFVVHYDNLLDPNPQKTTAFAAGQSDITYNIQNPSGRQIPGTHFLTQGATRPVVLADAHRPGQVYVIADNDPTHGAGAPYARVYIARSVDNGQAWSTPAPITAPTGSDFQLFPAAAIDRFGTVVVAWYGNKNNQSVPNAAPFASGTHFLLDVFATYSGDGGVHWAPQYQVNDAANHFDPDLAAPIVISGTNPTSSIGDHFGLGVFGGTAYVAWDGNGVDAQNHPIQQVEFNGLPIQGGLEVTGDEGQTTNPSVTLRTMVGRDAFVELIVNGNREYAGLWPALKGDITSSLASGGIRIDGNFGAYTVNVENTFSAQIGSDTVTVNTSITLGGGSDTINLSPLANNLANLRGPLTIHGAGGTNTLNVNDQADVRNLTFTMTANSLTATPAMVTYTEMDNVVVNCGPGANTFNIQGTPTNVQTTVNTGIGDDTINVGSPTHTLDPFQGLLAINGQPGIDHLAIDDSGATTSKGYFLNDTFFTRSESNGTGTRRINYGTIEFLDIKGAHSTAGNVVMVDNTAGGVVTTFDTGTGPDSVFVDRTNSQGPLTIDGEDGNDRVTLASRAAGLGLREIAGPVTILNAHGHTALTADDSDDPVGRTATLTVPATGTTLNSIAGLAAGEIHFENRLTSLTVAGGSGGNTFTVNGTVRGITTTLRTGSGTNTANVLATFATGPLSLTAGGVDNVNIGNTLDGVDDIQALVTVLNTQGCNLTVNDAASVTDKTYTMDANGIAFPQLTSPALVNYAGAHLLSLTLNGSLGSDRYNVLNTPAAVATTVNIGSGVDTTSVAGTGSNSQLTLNGSGGNRTEVVNLGVADQAPTLHSLQGIHGVLTVNALSNFVVLNVDDSANSQRRSPSLFANVLTGLAPADLYFAQGSIGALNIFIGHGGTLAASYIFTVNDTPNNGIMPLTTLQTEANLADPTNPFVNQVDILRTAGPLTVVGGSGLGSIDTVTVGAPFSQYDRGGTLENIRGKVTVTRTAGFTGVNITDLTDPVGHTFTLDFNALHGLAPADIEYRGDRLKYLNVLAGVLNTGGNTVAVLNTPFNADINTPTTLGLGIGDTDNTKGTKGALKVIRVVPLGPAGPTPPTGSITITIGDNGNLQGIQGPITIATGGNVTQLTVDDSRDPTGQVATLFGDHLHGLAPADINFTSADLNTLTVNGGPNGNVFTVANTPADPVLTTLNTGSTGATGATVYVQATTGPLTINTTGGTNTVNIGSGGPPPANSTIDGIQGPVTVNGGGGITTLNVNDQSKPALAGRTYGIAATTVNRTGDPVSTATITYRSVARLVVNGSSSYSVTGTASGTNTTINGGNGDDTVLVEGTAGPLTINLGGGTDTVSISPTAHDLANVQGNVTVNGGAGADTLTVNDQAGPVDVTYTLTDSTLTRDNSALITYSLLTTLVINGTVGDDTYNVVDTSLFAGCTTTINTNNGVDTVNVFDTTGPLSVHVGTSDRVNVFGSGPTGALTVDGGDSPAPETLNLGLGNTQPIRGNVSFVNVGAGSTLNVDDSIDTGPRNATLASNPLTSTGTITGLAPGTITYGYAPLHAITVSGGSGGNTFTVDETPLGVPTTLNTGSGIDTGNVLATTATGTLNITSFGGFGLDAVNVGNAGNAQGIQGIVNIANPPSFTRLTVDDSNDPNPSPDVTVDIDHISGLTALAGPIQFQEGNLNYVTLRGGMGGNTFNVRRTSGNTVATNIFAGAADNNTVNIGTDLNALNGIGGDVIVDGQGGANQRNTLNILDRATGAGVGYTLSDNTLTRNNLTATIVFSNFATGTFQIAPASLVVLIPGNGRPPSAPTLDWTVNGEGDTLEVQGNPGAAVTWHVFDTNAVMLDLSADFNSRVTFLGCQSLLGGPEDDTFAFDGASGVTGIIDGGAGSNTLDYTNYAGAGPDIMLGDPPTSGTADNIGVAFFNIQSIVGAGGGSSPSLGQEAGGSPHHEGA